MKHLIRNLLLASGATLTLGSLVFAAPVGAHNGEIHEAQARPGEAVKTEPAGQRAQGKLTEARLKACSQRLSSIRSIMSRRAELGQRHMQTFDKIVERVKAYYTEKQLTVANYQQLLDAVAAKKAAVLAVVENLKKTNFSCDSDNPQGTAEAFKTNLRSLNQALKDYRTAIKDLIAVVKSAKSSTEARQ